MAAPEASKMAAIRLSVLGMAAEGMSAWLAAQAVLLPPEAGSIVGEFGVLGGGKSDGGVGCEKGEGWKAADGGGEGVVP